MDWGKLGGVAENIGMFFPQIQKSSASKGAWFRGCPMLELRLVMVCKSGIECG